MPDYSMVNLGNDAPHGGGIADTGASDQTTRRSTSRFPMSLQRATPSPLPAARS